MKYQYWWLKWCYFGRGKIIERPVNKKKKIKDYKLDTFHSYYIHNCWDIQNLI